MGIINKIRFLLWIFVFFGIITAYVDYNRMINGQVPVFCKVTYDEFQKLETFRGIFYVANRTVTRNPKERLAISSNIHYQFLNQDIHIKLKPVSKDHDFVLYVTPSLYCPDDLRVYHEFEDKKIYIDCIANIRVKYKEEKESRYLNEILAEDSSVLNDILLNMSFTGIEDNKTTERYLVNDSSFTSNPFYLYKCHNGNNRDIYITMNPNKRNYCS